jgi:peroxiredoxin
MNLAAEASSTDAPSVTVPVECIQKQTIEAIWSTQHGGRTNENDVDFELTTCLVCFAPFANVQQAGLVCFNDEDNYIKWVCEWHDVHGGRVFSLVRETAGRPAVNPCGYAMVQGERVWLRLTKRGNRYEYAASSDGESSHAFGEVTWGDRSPKWLGLVAKNSAGAGAPELDASFDFFRIRQMPAGDQPVDPDIVPEGGPDELLEYIKALKEHRPGATQAMLAAAQRILRQRPADDTAESLRTALLLVLEDRIRTLPRVDIQRQRETVQYLKMLIEAIADKRAFDVTMSAVQALERAGQWELAAEACRSFAELIGQNEDKDLARLAEQFVTIARRVELAGSKLEQLEGTTIDGAELDWDALQGKVVLVCFWPAPTRFHRAEMAAIQGFYDLYHDLGFEVVGISTDENRHELLAFLNEQQIPWVTVHDRDSDGEHPIAERFGIGNMPRAFLIDREGTVVTINARGGRRAELLKELLGPSYQHGSTLAIAGQWDQLAADFEKVVVIEPGNGGAWQSLAVAYLQDEDTGGFQKTCRRAFKQLAGSHIWAQASLVQSKGHRLPTICRRVGSSGRRIESCGAKRNAWSVVRQTEQDAATERGSRLAPYLALFFSNC